MRIYMVTRDDIHPVGRWQREHFIAGHPALELANTVAYRRNADTHEDWIAKPRDLADWSISMGLDQATSKVKAEQVPRLRAMREAIYEVFSARAAGKDPPSAPVALLLRTAAQRFEGEGRPRLDTEIAWQAISALFTIPQDRIGECPRCGWLFIDRSKGGRRRWCSMAVCGTSEKVKAFRQRNSGR